MEKSNFESFVNKYNLGGSCESVLLVTENSKLSTRSISDDKNVLCEVSGPSMGLPDGSFPVYDTAKLRSLLGVLGGNLSVSVTENQSKPTSIKFTDTVSGTVATFVLADANVIPDVPDLKTVPHFDVTISLDKQFVNTFIKAKSALSEIETFTVESESGSENADIVLGYSTLNTNRIKISATKTNVDSSIEPISFSANYLREILVANKDSGNGVLEVSSKGISRVVFDNSVVTATYYLVQIDTRD